MPSDGGGRCQNQLRALAFGRSKDPISGSFSPEVPILSPTGSLFGVTACCPVPESFPDLEVYPFEDLFGDDVTMKIGPSPDHWVQDFNEILLGNRLDDYSGMGIAYKNSSILFLSIKGSTTPLLIKETQMRKTNKMKKITVAMGLALAMSVGAGVGAKTALATTISGGTPAYLSTPELSTAPISGGFSFQTSATGSNTYYASSTSLYGNTIPTVSELGSLTGLSAANFDSQSITDTNPTVFYSPSSLNLTQIATQTQAFQLGSSSGGGTEVTGNVISDVFQIGSASPTMAGAVPGDLVFTYQFDVTGVVSNNNSGVFSATVTAFNDPNGTAYTLGSGINTSSIGTAFGSTLPAITQYNPDNNPVLRRAMLARTVGPAGLLP